MPIKRIRTKACERCEETNDVLYRVRVDESQRWIFICPGCLEHVKPNNPLYQYGETWKSKKLPTRPAKVPYVVFANVGDVGLVQTSTFGALLATPELHNPATFVHEFTICRLV